MPPLLMSYQRYRYPSSECTVPTFYRSVFIPRVKTVGPITKSFLKRSYATIVLVKRLRGSVAFSVSKSISVFN